MKLFFIMFSFRNNYRKYIILRVLFLFISYFYSILCNYMLNILFLGRARHGRKMRYPHIQQDRMKMNSMLVRSNLSQDAIKAGY